MAFVDRKIQMMTQFGNNFTGVPSAQIVWDGVPNKSIDKNSPWISFYIDPVAGNFGSMGATRRIRHTGFVVVQIFIKPGTTTKDADTLVDDVADTLESKCLIDGVTFGVTEIVRVGVRDGYQQINTFTRYRYDDLRS